MELPGPGNEDGFSAFGSCSFVPVGWIGTGPCLGEPPPLYDGEGTGEARRAIEAYLAPLSGAGEPERLDADIGDDGPSCFEGPSPLSDILNIRVARKRLKRNP